MSTNLMQASQQWSSRPADERFVSLTELHNYVTRERIASHARVVPSRQISAQALPASEHKGMVVVGPNGGQLTVSNYAFGQLSQLAGAPAGYLRKLPAELAADNLNYGLHVERDTRDVGVLYARDKETGVGTLRAATGPNYGRVWNSDITAALVQRFGDGVSGDFRVPGEFGKRVPITKKNTTLYASDRDMFVFLADEEHRIEIPDRRDGRAGSLARGFFVWNSEVGEATLGVALFLFDYVCCNRIVWGARDFRQITVRHTVSAPDRFVHEVTPQLVEYANSQTAPVVAQIAAAKKQKVADIEEFLASRKFTASQIATTKQVFELEEARPMETLWDITTGLTAMAKGITYQNERVAIERQAGKILDMARVS